MLTYEELTPEIMEEYTVIVNCTPVGMYPKVDFCLSRGLGDVYKRQIISCFPICNIRERAKDEPSKWDGKTGSMFCNG